MALQINNLNDKFIEETQVISLEDQGKASHQVVSIACARRHMHSEIKQYSTRLQHHIRDYISGVSKEIAEEVIMAQITLHV